MPKSKRCWKLFTSQINSYEKRTPIIEIRENGKTWPKLTKNATNSGMIKQSQRKTGGHPAARPPTTTTAKIISLW